MNSSAEQTLYKTDPLPDNSVKDDEQWTEVIKPETSLLDLRLNELWHYRDLIAMFIRRDFVATYKQTILGPIWFFLAPLLTTVIYIVIFSYVAKLSTDGVPPVLFYLSGITIWNYFSITLTSTSNVFLGNAHIFGKVYFPRLTMPLSIVVSNLLRFFIQLSLFIVVLAYFLIKGAPLQPNGYIALLPLLLIIMALLSLGLGLIFSALTTKYRDLAILLSFIIQLLMYGTPVIYPLSSVPQKIKWLIVANPITSIIETFRYAFLGSGAINWLHLGYSAAVAVLVLLLGIIIFNKTEKTFNDVV